jgi:hypothetical protein
MESTSQSESPSPLEVEFFSSVAPPFPEEGSDCENHQQAERRTARSGVIAMFLAPRAVDRTSWRDLDITPVMINEAYHMVHMFRLKTWFVSV